MICETCHGSGNRIHQVHNRTGMLECFLPCVTCGGSGFDYCCVGSERYGQLDGESTGRESSAASKTDGTERCSGQDGGSPPLETITEADLLRGLEDLGLTFTDVSA